ncbi:MAG: BMP family ABC transporter substrate-binding protein [Lachnospiraceae bacterium]|nr:BMP family ABC transporter substrate-binding protein [Lachnospiraceae bacterium]
MKKVLSLILMLAMAVTMLTGCGSSKSTYELALVTDVGTIDDKSFNQGAWEGLEKYAKENNKTYKYYQPAEATDASYIETIALAVKGGAKLIVCPGYKFETALYEVQTTYPDVDFIILDGEPHSEDYSEYRTDSNVYAIYYAEQQAGFLAGYAAVKEGYTKLGFMGGMAVPAVMNYGYGFVSGAETAAKELGLESVDVKYHYTGGFIATPEAQTMAASWYQNGTEVIFGCGGAVGNSVMAAAEANNGKVIGVDVDQSPESDTVILSALKMLSNSVYDGITAFYAGSFPGGQVVTLDATSNAVGLPMDTAKLEKFTKADYETLYAKLLAGEYTPFKNTDAESVSDLPLSIVAVEEVK